VVIHLSKEDFYYSDSYFSYYCLRYFYMQFKQKYGPWAVIAGATASPAYLKTDPKYGKLKPQVMHPDAVAEAALKKLGKKTLFIPGFSNRFNYFILTKLLPRRMASRIANITMKKMYS
jgi:short-subunit dehydrogenase